jgi:hypothetical protein
MLSLNYWSFLNFKCTPLSLCSAALAVTLPGFAGEEYLPLPRSKGGAFPFLLTLGGCPTASANVAQGQWCSLVKNTLQSQYVPETPHGELRKLLLNYH